MNSLKICCLLLSCSLLVLKSFAQETNDKTFTLQQSIEYAYKNSPNYLNAENDVLMAKYKRKEVLGMAMPQINSSVDFKDFIEIPTSLLPGQIFGGAAGTFIPVQFGTKFNANYGANFNQILFLYI